jgi:superfamily II RNA helicase
VLKASDEGILVYVAPTKALVNQIAAEVISRFRKNYRQTGKTVWAIHTRDYRMNDPNSCQILVTVPQILSIMLLSPTNAAKWSPRIKRIIFDEVHSIGNADDGVVWEQLLLLSPCPIIALSATVGNPEEFSDWLQSTQRSLGVHLEMIKHPYRYSDLSKYVYQPPADLFEDQPFQGLQKSVKFGQVDGAAGLEALHPVASLVDPTQGMPDDLALEPKDCLSLYRCMIDVKTDDFPVPDNLDYHRVFGESGTVIKKVDVIEWEVALKSILKEWMDDPRSPFQKLIRKLGSKKKPVRRPSKVGRKDSISSQGEDTRLKSSVLEYGTLPLLSVLNSENALPAILFSYDRKLCENLCLSLCSQLERGEAEWRDKDPRWKATVAKWEAWNKTNKSRASKPRTTVPTDGATKADMMMEQADREQSSIESFNPLNPSPEFSFADIRKCTEAEFEQEIRFLDATSPLVMAFKRGIGVHHAGMNRKYRQA